MNNLTKVDIRLHGKTHSFRIALPVWQAFERMAKEDKWSISQAAEIAQRGHNGTLPEAITAYVLKHTSVPLHTTREAWLGALVELMRPVFKQRGYPLPTTIRAAIAFTSKGWRGKVRGECWSPEVSGDNATEIMVCLREKDPVRILNILTHELCHAAQHVLATERGTPKLAGGHGRIWTEVSTAMDVTVGKGTHAMGDPAGAWGDWAVEMLGKVGPMPHHAIAEHVAKAKKQTTRMLKFEHENCPGDPDGISIVWRMSAKGVADKNQVSCPCCGARVVNPHYEGEEASEGDVDEALEDDGGLDSRETETLRPRKRTRRAASTMPRDDSPARRYGRKSQVQEMLDRAAILSADPNADWVES